MFQNNREFGAVSFSCGVAEQNRRTIHIVVNDVKILQAEATSWRNPPEASLSDFVSLQEVSTTCLLSSLNLITGEIILKLFHASRYYFIVM